MVPPIEVVYAREELGTTAAGLGALMAAWGIGAIAGSALFARIGGRGMITVAATATAAMGVSYLGMGLAATLPVACVLSAVGGVGNGMQWIAFVTAIQTRVPGRAAGPRDGARRVAGLSGPRHRLRARRQRSPPPTSARVAYVVAGAGILAIVARRRVRASELLPAERRATAQPA